MKTQKWTVCGWRDSEHVEGKAPDFTVEVTAKDEGEADEKGDRKIQRLHGEKCMAINSYPKPQK